MKAPKSPAAQDRTTHPLLLEVLPSTKVGLNSPTGSGQTTSEEAKVPHKTTSVEQTNTIETSTPNSVLGLPFANNFDPSESGPIKPDRLGARSLVIKLKVEIPQTSTESEGYRNPRRERRPTEKLRLIDSASYDDVAPPNGSHTKVARNPLRRSNFKRKPKSQTRRGRGRAAQPRRWRDRVDGDVGGDEFRRYPRNGRQRKTTNAFVPAAEDDSSYLNEGIEADNARTVRELNLNDFVAPSTYGFPVRIIDTSEEKDDRRLTTSNPPSNQSHLTASNLPEHRKIGGRDDPPATLEFWIDWFLAEQAFRSSNVDFKLMCLNFIKLRDKFYIPKITVNNPLSQGTSYFFGYKIGGQGRGNWNDKVGSDAERATRTKWMMRDILPPYGVACRKDPDDSSILLTYTDWDVLLASIRMVAKDMHSRRRWRVKGKKNEAGWATWEQHMRRHSRGSFIEQTQDEITAGTATENWDHDEEYDMRCSNGIGSRNCASVAPSLSLGYKRKGLSVQQNGSMTCRLGRHWEEAAVSNASPACKKPKLWTDHGCNGAQVKQGFQSMVEQDDIGEEVVEDGRGVADMYDPTSLCLLRTRRKLFTPGTLMSMK